MKKLFYFLFLTMFFIYAAGWYFCRAVYPSAYRGLIEKVAQENQLDPLLVGAIVFCESRYKEKAVSPAGALGLMQVMPLTGAEAAREMGLGEITSEDLLSRDQNIRIGCFYFAKLKRRLEDQDWLALAAYNAGESKIRSWVQRADPQRSRLSKLEFPETRKYVRKIEMIYFGLRLCRKLYLVS